MFAALPMYDPPELHHANDALWTSMADRLRANGLGSVPDRLTRGEDLKTLWLKGGLLLGQTCGYPLVTELAGRVQVVATPVYRAEGCEGAFYRSAIVVAKTSSAGHLGHLRGARCALNDWTSNSGMNLLRAKIAPLAENGRFFGEIIESGSHRQSLALIAQGAADIAAIDCVTLAFLRRVDPALVGAVRILDWTALSPSLPFITGLDTDPDLLRAALEDPCLAEVRQALLIEGFQQVSYQPILALERGAADQGYPVLA